MERKWQEAIDYYLVSEYSCWLQDNEEEDWVPVDAHRSYFKAFLTQSILNPRYRDSLPWAVNKTIPGLQEVFEEVLVELAADKLDLDGWLRQTILDQFLVLMYRDFSDDEYAAGWYSMYRWEEDGDLEPPLAFKDYLRDRMEVIFSAHPFKDYEQAGMPALRRIFKELLNEATQDV